MKKKAAATVASSNAVSAPLFGKPVPTEKVLFEMP